MIFSVGYVFYFCHYIFGFVGIVFLRILWFLIFASFLLLSVFGSVKFYTDLRFCSYSILILAFDIYDYDSNLMHCNICTFVLSVSFGLVPRYQNFVFFSTGSLLIFFSVRCQQFRYSILFVLSVLCISLNLFNYFWCN